MTDRNKIWHRFTTISLYGMSQLMMLASVLLISFVVVRWHSTELWGHYAELLIWSNVILMVLGFGSHDYLLRRFSDAPSKIYQVWTSNFITRGLLLIPALTLVLLLPFFREVIWGMALWVVLYFVNSSFRVLILFHRNFTFNILVEAIYNVVVIGLLFWFLESLDLRTLILAIVIGQGVKTLLFSGFYLGKFKNIKWQYDFKGLSASVPFFIPMAVGTLRMKMDAYYGTWFFDAHDLSKYQVFLSFLMLAQMAGPFVLNPYLKNFYRSGEVLVGKLHKTFFSLGWLLALAMTGVMYVALTFIYEFDFTWEQYALGFAFMVPLMVHTTLVNEYYKKYLQKKIALFSSVLVVLQVVLGYYLIQSFEIDGALLLKVLGQWGIVIALWLWIRNRREK